MSEQVPAGTSGASASGEIQRSIYLVRHGEAAASWGHASDPGLSELGHEQASASCEQLTASLDAGSASLISSPLLRARETAAPLAQQLQRPVQVDERFREIPSTVPLEHRQDWLRAFMRSQWSEQETVLHEWRSAILDAFAALDDQSVVFTHFLVLNTILGWAEDRDDTLLFWPANASVTVARQSINGSWRFELGEQMRTRVN